MTRRESGASFFFLKDPAPTEISPLSLHAALPISSEPQRHDSHGRAGHVRPHVRNLPDQLDSRQLGEVADRRHGPAAHEVNLALRVAPPDLRPDRKSTRLNSSHLVISYAVFCLKKK